MKTSNSVGGGGLTGQRSLGAYPQYRDSEVEWLGEIPAHWKVARVRDHAFLINGFPFDSQYFTRDDGAPLVRIRDVWSDRTEVNYAGPVTEDVWIDPGDLIVGMDGDFNVSQWKGPRALLNQRICCLRARPSLGLRFLAYLLPTPLKIINDLTYATTVKHLSSSDIGKIRFGLCPVAEQAAICEFLDGETAKIDMLLAKKERLIELLQEKRTALIAHAVTTGLDPTVPMKDSGVGWLGEIPAHWEVWRTKFVARLESGHTPSRQHPEYWENCDVPWFTLADVWQIRDGRREYVTETAERISQLGLANSAARLLPKGTVMVSRTASVGFSAIMGTEMATTQDFVNWVCGPRMRPEYLLYVFRSMEQEFDRLTMGSTHQTIYMPDVGQFVTPVPPLAEQDRIVAYVRDEGRKIDTLMAKVGEAIERIREYRSALISAAVTGKIDVREEVAALPRPA
jgi:type I restriction enzyme S subunit